MGNCPKICQCQTIYNAMCIISLLNKIWKLWNVIILFTNNGNSLDFKKSYLAPDLCLYVTSKAEFSCPHICTISLFHFVLGLQRGYLFIIKFSLDTWKESTLHVYIYTIAVFDASLFLLVFVSTSPLTSCFRIFCLVRFILILWSCLVYPYFCWLYQGQESDVLYYRTLLSFIFLGPDDMSNGLMKFIGSAGLKYRSKIGHGHLPCFSQWTLLFHLHVPVV